MNTTLYQNPPWETYNWTNLHLETHDYWIHFVNIDLHHQYGISVPESQTFLIAKSPQPRGARRNLCFCRLTKNWWCNISRMRCSVSSPDETLRGELILVWEVKDAKMSWVFHLISKHSLNINFLCIFFMNYSWVWEVWISKPTHDQSLD